MGVKTTYAELASCYAALIEKYNALCTRHAKCLAQLKRYQQRTQKGNHGTRRTR